jgi:hypothetical protein
LEFNLTEEQVGSLISLLLEKLNRPVDPPINPPVDPKGAIEKQISQIQEQLIFLRIEIMTSFEQIIKGVQGNSVLIAQAGAELLSINSRISQLSKGQPTDEQLEEMQTLVDQQGKGLLQIIDTAKQTAPMIKSPVEPTPVPIDGSETTPPVVPAPIEEPAPVVIAPTLPEEIEVQPSPDEIGLPGSVEIDASIVDAPTEDPEIEEPTSAPTEEIPPAPKPF